MDIASGVLLDAPHVISSSLNTVALLLIGSIALVMVLFADASRISLILK
jgi:hypothetical protein